MKNIFRIGYALCLCLLVVSCRGQVKKTPPVESIPPVQAPPVDHDPYFNGNQLLVTSFGPTTITRNVLEDKTGNIWFATWEGIVRFDGSSFTNLTNKEGLRRYRAFSLLEDKAGMVWIGTIGAGLYRYDSRATSAGKSGFTNLTTKDGLVNNDIQCLYEDKKGHLWIGTRNGLSVYDGKTFRNFSKADGMPDADVNAILEDEEGKIWLGVRGEASVYDGQSFTKLTRQDGASFTNVRTTLKDQKGHIWLAGQDGLWRYDGESYLKIDPDFSGYVYEDKAGNIWMAKSTPSNTYQMMLYRYAAGELTSSTPKPKEIDNPDGQVFGIMEDSKGRIWYGTERGPIRYDGTNFEDFRQ